MAPRRDRGDRPAGGFAGRTLADSTVSFWFFSPGNLEVFVKMLDGRRLNGHYWVFYGSLPDVEYRIRVEDQMMGEVRTYGHAAGDLCGEGNTLAFPDTSSALSSLPEALDLGAVASTGFELEALSRPRPRKPACPDHEPCACSPAASGSWWIGRLPRLGRAAPAELSPKLGPAGGSGRGPSP